MDTALILLASSTLLLVCAVLYLTWNRSEVIRQRNEALKNLAAVKADADARLEEIGKARDDLDTHFKGIAAEVVKTNSEALLVQAHEQFTSHAKLSSADLEQRQQAIRDLVKPIKQNLDKFQEQVSAIETKREGAYAGLKAEIGSLQRVTGRLGEALRSSQIRGRWGEQQLRNILELAGLREHLDFLEQETVGSNEAKGRPDAVVRVPGGVRVVIDAKTPLDAYLDAHDSSDETDREKLLQSHASKLLSHARILGRRDYSSMIAGSPGFVVMFVPTDPILDAAMTVQPMLWENAWTKYRVLIATPGLLLAFLRTVALAWQEQAVQENAKQIAATGKEMYDRLRTYFGHVTKMGRSLEQAVNSYNASIGSFESRVLPQARRFEELGATTGGKGIDTLTQVESVIRVPRLPTGEGSA